MRVPVALAVLAALPLIASAQGLAPRSSAQYVTIATSMSGVSAAPGGSLTLWLDVTPKRNTHVYAPGAKDFTPVALVMTPNAGVTWAKPQYPAGILAATLGATKPVPIYRDVFRIAQTLHVSRTATAGTLRLSGAFNYQACDETTCYAAASLPAFWTITVK